MTAREVVTPSVLKKRYTPRSGAFLNAFVLSWLLYLITVRRDVPTSSQRSERSERSVSYSGSYS